MLSNTDSFIVMPGIDHIDRFGVVILTMFGVLELVSSLNTKRRKVTA